MVPPRLIIIPQTPVAEPLSASGSDSMTTAWLTGNSRTAQRPRTAIMAMSIMGDCTWGRMAKAATLASSPVTIGRKRPILSETVPTMGRATAVISAFAVRARPMSTVLKPSTLAANIGMKVGSIQWQKAWAKTAAEPATTALLAKRRLIVAGNSCDELRRLPRDVPTAPPLVVTAREEHEDDDRRHRDDAR